MPPTYKSVCNAISLTDPKDIVSILLEKAQEGGETLDAVLLLFSDLVANVDKPPLIRTLDTLMEEPILTNAFKKYLRECFCYEAWEFWLDAKAFRSLDFESNELETLAEAYRIHETFIKEGAPQEVNISAEQREKISSIFSVLTGLDTDKRDSGGLSAKEKANDRKRISKIISSSECISNIQIEPKLFYIAELEIRRILERTHLHDFCSTELYESKYKTLKTKKSIEENSENRNIHDTGLLPVEWNILLQEAEPIMLSEGDTLVSQGEYAPYLFCVMEGELQSSHTTEVHKKAFNFPLKVGDLFGELTIFTSSFRSFSTVTVVSPMATLKRLNLPIVFQYFKCEPVVAIRWYCMTGIHFAKLLREIDLYDENKKIDDLVAFSTNISLEHEDADCSSLLFKKLFPELKGQHVFCECNAALQGSLRSRTVVIYITSDYFCYYYSRHDNSVAKAILLMELDINSGKSESLFLCVHKKKLVFKFTSPTVKSMVYDMMITLIAAKKGPVSLDTHMRALVKCQQNPSDDDWKLLLETARQHSESNMTMDGCLTPRGGINLTNHTYHATYSFGDVITGQGHNNTRLIRIISGSCAEKRTHIDENGRLQTKDIRDLAMDEIAGERGFFISEPSHCSLVANEADVKVLEVSRDFVQTIFFAQNPQSVVRFYNLFCRTMAQRIVRGFNTCKD